ncbi:hypothetical protein BT63DRAFT_291143 [Microthyrium microscopicum]|uniref:Uncharacterized protein n=1 Tax=Microthyrium microscopicum TaxID=703497 RepID=A0A6A6U544_9PEZI|nr:hypothetical protein BT63DRAFT_291143 [Microthyrium microscopicum]
MSPEIQIDNPYPSIFTQSRNYKRQEDNLYDWYQSFAKGIIGLSTFGASITFSVILSNLPDPITIRAKQSSKLFKKIKFNEEAVRQFLSIAWLMFVLALGFAIISLVQLKKHSTIGSGMKVLEIVLQWLVLAAFMFLSLAVAAYTPDVGMAGVGFISLFALMVLGMGCGG